MAVSKLTTSLWAVATFFVFTEAQKFPSEDLILCDCGIGDDSKHPEWSTSRQINWYQDIAWPESAYKYPDAPDMYVEVPYNEGKYPWIPEGVTATLSNGDVWTAYIEDGTPDGFKAGSAVTTKEGGHMLNCWAYRGRPVSAAVNTTVADPAICWSAFVCNRDSKPPKRPDDMGSPTSSASTSSAAPTTSVFSETPGTPEPTPTTTGDEPAPTSSPHTGSLLIDTSVNPRFINWPNTWQSFINNFVWDQTTGECVGPPIRSTGYNITIECAGVQLDADSHMTLLLIQALRDVGLNSLWFNQNPVVPGNDSGNSTSWVVMPEAFSIQAVDASNQHVVGHLSYTTKYDSFLTGPCSTCDTARFNSNFFDPIIGAMQGSYPIFNSYTVQAECDPWMVC